MFSNRTKWDLAPNSLSVVLEELRRAGRTWLDLTASNPTTIGLSYESDRLKAALQSSESLIYSPNPRGLSLARTAVASYYEELSVPCTMDPKKLILTTSTSEAYTYAFRLLCNPGDNILIPTPSYPLFEFLGQLQDVELRPFELIYDHGWQIDVHSLERAITDKTRAIILVHLNNPTGSYVKPHEADQLNRIAREHEMALIVDEVFLDYALDSEPHRSFVGNKDSLTFTMSGLSKIAGLPQMKMAWMAVSGPEREQRTSLDRLEVIADTYLSMNAPIQHAAAELLSSRHAIQEQIMNRVRLNLDELDRLLAAKRSCSRLTIEGGWYAVLRVPATRTDDEFAVTLLRDGGVLVHPGHFFDFQSDGFLVVSLITPEADFREGIRRVLQLAN